MNKEKIKFDKHEDMEKYLYDKYPVIFQDKNKDMSQSCMFWGIDCGVGWTNIINNLCEKLEFIAEQHKIQVIADQVKEKYGSLRFYYHTQPVKNTPITQTMDAIYFLLRKCNIWVQYTFACIGLDVITKDNNDKIVFDIIETLVQDAENRSEHTCEVCGEYGKICGKGWIKTLCKECADKTPNYKYDEKDEGI